MVSEYDFGAQKSVKYLYAWKFIIELGKESKLYAMMVTFAHLPL